MGEPLELERAGAAVGELGAGEERAAAEFNRALELVRPAADFLFAPKDDARGLRADLPCGGFGHHDHASVIARERAGTRGEALARAPEEWLAGGRAVAEGLGQALAIERTRGRARPLRPGQQRADLAVTNLPDEATPAEARSEARVVRDGIEQVNREFGIGNVEHVSEAVMGFGSEECDVGLLTTNYTDRYG